MAIVNYTITGMYPPFTIFLKEGSVTGNTVSSAFVQESDVEESFPDEVFDGTYFIEVYDSQGGVDIEGIVVTGSPVPSATAQINLTVNTIPSDNESSTNVTVAFQDVLTGDTQVSRGGSSDFSSTFIINNTENIEVFLSGTINQPSDINVAAYEIRYIKNGILQQTETGGGGVTTGFSADEIFTVNDLVSGDTARIEIVVDYES
jgi:hypothetical protein